MMFLSLKSAFVMSKDYLITYYLKSLWQQFNHLIFHTVTLHTVTLAGNAVVTLEL